MKNSGIQYCAGLGYLDKDSFVRDYYGEIYGFVAMSFGHIPWIRFVISFVNSRLFHVYYEMHEKSRSKRQPCRCIRHNVPDLMSMNDAFNFIIDKAKNYGYDFE